MSDLTKQLEPVDPITQIDPKSTMLFKAPPDLRANLAKSIINRDPPSYKAVFEKYHLAEKGISFHAFYRFARRLRNRAAAANIADLTAPGSPDFDATMPKLISQQLAESLLYEDPTPGNLDRLVNAWCKSRKVILQLDRQTAEIKAAEASTNHFQKMKELDECKSLLQVCVKVMAKQVQEHIQNMEQLDESRAQRLSQRLTELMQARDQDAECDTQSEPRPSGSAE